MTSQLPAESACAEVESCQVLALLGTSKTSCSAPLELAHVYLENNLGEPKKKIFPVIICKRNLHGDDGGIPALEESCLDTDNPGHQNQGIPFCSFEDRHALCSELVPNVLRGLPCVKCRL